MNKLRKLNVRTICNALSVCLFLTPPVFAPTPKQKPLHEQVATYDEYLRACYHHAAGKFSKTPQESTRHLNRSFDIHRQLQHKNTPIYSTEALLYLLFDAGRFDIINNIYQQKKEDLEKTFKNNIEIKLILAQGALYAGNKNDAQDLFAQLNKEYPDNMQVAYYTAVALMKNEKLDEALAYLEKHLDDPAFKQKHFLFHFLSSKIYEQKKQMTHALESIKKSIEFFPNFEKAWLFKAYLHEKLGAMSDAIQGYKQYLKIIEQDPEVEQQLVQLLFSQRRFSEAADYLKKMNPENPDTLFNLALTQMRAQQLAEALESINKAISQFAQRAKQAQGQQAVSTNTVNVALFTQARLMKIEILLALKKPTAALAFTEKWLQEVPQNVSVIHTLLLLRRAGVMTQNIVHSLERVYKTSQSKGIMAALGDLYLDLGNPKKALEYYQNLLAIAQDQRFKSSLLFQIGHIYFNLNKPAKEVEQVLKQAIAYKKPLRTIQTLATPDTPVIDLDRTDPSVLNLLAVLYYTHRIKLDQALRLSNILIEKFPECSYYLHTNACLLLLSEKNKRESTITACKLLKRAHILAPHDTIISTLLTQTLSDLKKDKLKQKLAVQR